LDWIAMHATPCPHSADDSPRRVLIVEDSPDNRETLRLVVEGWGHEVDVAPDGGAGLEKALAWQPDAAIVDIGLPVLDGYELARRLRTRLGARPVLIALSGYSQPEDRRRAMAAGFNAYFTKPADLDRLSKMLKAVAS
jgi:CheY-like chemotaxis protein